MHDPSRSAEAGRHPLTTRWRSAALGTACGLTLVCAALAADHLDDYVIVRFEQRTLVVGAKEASGDRTFQFKLCDASQLRVLRPQLAFGVEPPLQALAAGQRFKIVLPNQGGRLSPQNIEVCGELMETAPTAAKTSAPGAALARPPVASSRQPLSQSGQPTGSKGAPGSGPGLTPENALSAGPPELGRRGQPAAGAPIFETIRSPARLSPENALTEGGASGQQPSSPGTPATEAAAGALAQGAPRPKVTLHSTIDPCAVANDFQLRAALQLALAAAFPFEADHGGLSLRLTNPILRELACPDLTITARTDLRVRFKQGPLSITKNGTVRFRSPGEVRVEFRAPLGSRQPESPSEVWDAQACLSDIDVVGLDIEGVPNWLDSNVIQACLNGDLPNWSGCRDVATAMCHDVTALVQAYVALGGEL